MSTPYFATRAGLPQGSCADCAYWGYLLGQDETARGTCGATADDQHEAVVSILIFRQIPGDQTGFVEIAGEERKLYRALPLTPADFSCASWTPHPDIQETP
jgi:hypothetical protein